jgi:hypothetical protein
VLSLALLSLLTAAPTDVAFSPPATKKGVTTRVLSFTDGKGAHRVTFAVLAPEQKPAGASQRLTVVHERQAKAGARWLKQWEAKDFVTDCEFDLTIALRGESVAVTDLDDDGEAEVSFLYVTGCQSDVSPLSQKLLLYEGASKYALRGTTEVTVGQDEKGVESRIGGEHQADPAFEKAPAAFLPFAKAQWEKFKRWKYGD